MILRLTLALLLLGGMLYLVGSEELWRVMLAVDFLNLFYLMLVSVIMIWASCLKWRLFIRAGGNDAPMGRLMVLYTVTYFVNVFTPSIVGGDIVRSFHLGQDLENQKDAFVATFLERFSGFLAMALLGVLFVCLGAKATAGLSVAILSVGAISVVAALPCFSEAAGKFTFRWLNRVLDMFGEHRWITRIRDILNKVDAGMAGARGNKRLLVYALLYSLLFHTLTVINTYTAALAIGWTDPNFAGLFVVVPLVLLVSMVPITPNGLGIQEGAFLFLLKRIGATEAQGLGVGILLRAKLMVLALFGGVLWWYVRRSPKAVQAAVQQSKALETV